MDNLADIIFQPGIYAWFGAVCGHILSLYSGKFKGCQPFLKKIFPDRSETFYVRFDFILLPIIGAVLSITLLDPDNAKSAVFAGLTWSGTLMSILTYNNK